MTLHGRRMFTKIVRDDARTIFTPMCADFGAEAVAMDGGADHVRILVNVSPGMESLNWCRASRVHQAFACARTMEPSSTVRGRANAPQRNAAEYAKRWPCVIAVTDTGL